MIRHYLAFAFGRLARAPFASAALVFTLALGLACFVAAYGAAAYLRSGDAFHPGAERLYYVCQDCRGTGRTPLAPAPLAAALREDVPELESVARLGFPEGDEMAVSTGRTKMFLAVAAADAELFDMLAFPVLEGDPKAALAAPGQIVLVEEAAQRLFQGEPALGRTVRLNGQRDATVGAVIARPRQPSLAGVLRFDALTDYTREPPGLSATWFSWYGFTIVRLRPAMSQEAFQARLDDLTMRRAGTALDGRPYTLEPVPLRELLTGGDPLARTSILIGFGALILLVACVSYANLAAAQTAGRLKETSMRKVLGAGRLQLLAQHALEAGLLVVPALALAVAAVALAAPVLRAMPVFGVDVTWFLSQGAEAGLLLAALALATPLVVAVYPALMTARVRAADALGSGQTRLGPGIVARALVGVQFFSVSFLLIVVTVIRLQIAHLEKVVLDPADDPVAALDDLGLSGVSLEALAAELRGEPRVRSVTSADAAPMNGGLIWYVGTSEEPGQPGWTVERRYVGPDYFETVGVDLVAGRGFDAAQDRSGLPQFDISGPLPSTPATIVIDERLVRTLGFGSPEAALGRTVYTRRASNPGAAGSPLGVVVGVTEENHEAMRGQGPIGSSGVFYAFDPAAEQARTPLIRVDRGDVPGALAAIERAWDRAAPDVPFRARFLDDIFVQATAGLRGTGELLIGLSAAAIAISTTGLLGIAVYVAARRRRELGIRKALGASAVRLGRMLVADFSKPVLAANLLAWPAGYLVAQANLQPFVDRIALTPLTFLVSTALTLAIAWAAVLGEVWKAARVRPAEVLRHA